jgi:hypothetical protein
VEKVKNENDIIRPCPRFFDLPYLHHKPTAAVAACSRLAAFKSLLLRQTDSGASWKTLDDKQ